MTRTALVTGAAGFVGRHVTEQLRAAGWVVRAVDIGLASSHPHGMPDLPDVIPLDVRDVEALAEVVDGVDAVSHQAGMVGLSTDWNDAVGYASHNDVGTAALLAALHRRGFDGSLVLASSMVVYGEGAYRCAWHGVVRPAPRRTRDLAAGRFDVRCPRCRRPVDPVPVTEAMGTDPRNVYAATKLHQEHLCGLFAREHDITLTILRYHNVYGPGMPRDTPYAGVASLFASELAAGRPPQVYEDGQQLRDFVHVHDVARANVVALTRDDHGVGTFNVASGQPRSVLEIAEALWRLHGDQRSRPRVVGGGRPGDVRHVFGSPDLARHGLGFAARVPFADGVRDLAALGRPHPAVPG